MKKEKALFGMSAKEFIMNASGSDIVREMQTDDEYRNVFENFNKGSQVPKPMLLPGESTCELIPRNSKEENDYSIEACDDNDVTPVIIKTKNDESLYKNGKEMVNNNDNNDDNNNNAAVYDNVNIPSCSSVIMDDEYSVPNSSSGAEYCMPNLKNDQTKEVEGEEKEENDVYVSQNKYAEQDPEYMVPTNADIVEYSSPQQLTPSSTNDNNNNTSKRRKKVPNKWRNSLFGQILPKKEKIYSNDIKNATSDPVIPVPTTSTTSTSADIEYTAPTLTDSPESAAIEYATPTSAAFDAPTSANIEYAPPTSADFNLPTPTGAPESADIEYASSASEDFKIIAPINAPTDTLE
eukprot:Pgem_evm1s15679